MFPNLNISHVHDAQKAYLDGLNNLVPRQSVSLTEFDLGIDFEAPVAVSRGELTLTGGLSGSYYRTAASGPAINYISVGDSWNSRVDLGLRYRAENGLTITTGAYLTGLTSNAPLQSYGATLQLEVGF